MAVEPVLGPNDLALEDAQHALEERVRRLESAVAALQEQQARQEAIRAGMPQVNLGPAFADPSDSSPSPADRPHRPWLLFDLLADLKAIARMFIDVRYRVAWSTWLAVIFIVLLILTSGWWFPLAYIPLVGDYLDKVLDFVLAFILYKALSREARRYRETVEGKR